jgi:hypothetical protein
MITTVTIEVPILGLHPHLYERVGWPNLHGGRLSSNVQRMLPVEGGVFTIAPKRSINAYIVFYWSPYHV